VYVFNCKQVEPGWSSFSALLTAAQHKGFGLLALPEPNPDAGCPNPDAGPSPTKSWLPRGFCFPFYVLSTFWPSLTNCTSAFYWLILGCLCLGLAVAVLNPDGAPCAALCTSPSLSKHSYQGLHSTSHFLGHNFTDPRADECLKCSDSDGLLYV